MQGLKLAFSLAFRSAHIAMRSSVWSLSRRYSSLTALISSALRSIVAWLTGLLFMFRVSRLVVVACSCLLVYTHSLHLSRGKTLNIVNSLKLVWYALLTMVKK